MMAPFVSEVGTPIFVSPPQKKTPRFTKRRIFLFYHFLIPQLFIQTFLADPAPFNKPWIVLGEGTPTLTHPIIYKKTRYSHSQSLAEVKRCFCRGFCARLEELIEKTKKQLTQHFGGGDRPAGWSLRFAQRIYKVGPW